MDRSSSKQENQKCGSWPSIIFSDHLTKRSISFQELEWDGQSLYWIESRPFEKGRNALIQYSQGSIKDILPEFNVRTRVHEYGGGALTVHGGKCYFTNDYDHNIYQLDEHHLLTPLISDPSLRIADMVVLHNEKALIGVAEKHHDAHHIENFLFYLDFASKKWRKLAQGHDFYSFPRISPDGKKLAFVTWDAPYMPWERTTLWVGQLTEDGSLDALKAIIQDESSVSQIAWSSKGVLHFVSDQSGYLNLYRYNEDQIEPLYSMDAEFGPAPWVFKKPAYAFLENGKIACIYTQRGIDYLGLLDPKEKRLKPLELPFTLFSNLCSSKTHLYFLGSSPHFPLSVIAYDLKANTYEVLKKSFEFDVDAKWISIPEQIEFPSMNGESGFAFYYPPKNPQVSLSNHEKPPLIVRAHGGPTSRALSQLNLEFLFWTTRGFAVVDVNYGGSTGYGRKYRERLNGQWGILDVHDCMAAAEYLVKKGIVDGKRLIIKGGSAGGFTALCSVCFMKKFAAAVSYYGVSDLEALVATTHKFEAHYLEHLIGPYPQEKKKYEERSPIHHVKQIDAAVLLLQGTKDTVVPPDQATKIYEILKSKKHPVTLVLLEGEGHGFRSSEAIQKSIEVELNFYQQIFNF
jgi:dipeptidyl aminopeptidase/acylaminoacyl peptidase